MRAPAGIDPAQLLRQAVEHHLEGRARAAESLYRRILAVEPAHPDALNGLGALAQQAGKRRLATELFCKAVASEPRRAEFHYNLAVAFRDSGRLADSERENREATRLRPDYAAAWNNLGTALLDQDRPREAGGAYREALRLEPSFPEIYWHLALCHALAPSDEAPIRRLLEEVDVSSAEACYLHFALGSLLDERGSYEQAFVQFEVANRIKRAGLRFDARRNAELVDRLMATFDRSLFSKRAGFGHESDEPVFVVGMSRSGKSLIERVIAHHPGVHPAGELGVLPSKSGRGLAEQTGSARPYPECAWDLDRRSVRSVAERYLERLRRDADPRALRLCDTLPFNFFHLGLIALLFPEARIIHCRRDPLDNGLFIYFKHFTRAHAYAYDLADIGIFYRHYERLMAHWRSVLPLPVLEVEYENLVAGTEAEARRLIDFLDLRWDEQAWGTAALASTQPLDGRWIGHWRHYARFLRPLEETLGIARPTPPGRASGLA